MINLLPPNAKKVVSREYAWRVTAVSFLALSVVLAVLALLFLPTWQLLRFSETAIGTHLSAAQAARSAYDELSGKVSDANALIDHLYRQLPRRQLAALISELDQLSMAEVTITEFSFNDDDTVSLSGIAASRSALASFRDRLENDPRFADVVLPLSSLAVDRDTPFTLTFSIVDPEEINI